MARRTVTGLGIVVLGVIFGVALGRPAGAQEVVTLALRNGERPAGQLVDMNASGLILQVRGEDRSFSLGEVAVVEFQIGAPPADVQARIAQGTPFIWLRNGQLVDGQLSDVGGTRPLRITMDTPGGSRTFPSNEVAQIFVNPPARASSAPSPGSTAPPAGAITVPANQAWTDTGLSVSRGQRIRFTATGNIMLSQSASSGVGGSPAVTDRSVPYPLRGVPAGALIGRVGNGPPFLIGANTELITMVSGGRLMVGINDDHLADNSGAYFVTVAREGGRVR